MKIFDTLNFISWCYYTIVLKWFYFLLLSLIFIVIFFMNPHPSSENFHFSTCLTFAIAVHCQMIIAASFIYTLSSFPWKEALVKCILFPFAVQEYKNYISQKWSPLFQNHSIDNYCYLGYFLIFLGILCFNWNTPRNDIAQWNYIYLPFIFGALIIQYGTFNLSGNLKEKAQYITEKMISHSFIASSIIFLLSFIKFLIDDSFSFNISRLGYVFLDFFMIYAFLASIMLILFVYYIIYHRIRYGLK